MGEARQRLPSIYCDLEPARALMRIRGILANGVAKICCFFDDLGDSWSVDGIEFASEFIVFFNSFVISPRAPKFNVGHDVVWRTSMRVCVMESSSQVPPRNTNIEFGGAGVAKTQNHKQRTPHLKHITAKSRFHLRTRFHQQ